MGEHCELCEDGFYFSGDESRRGTPQECQPCPCPEQSSCVLINDGGVVCTNCPPGHAGMDKWFPQFPAYPIHLSILHGSKACELLASHLIFAYHNRDIRRAITALSLRTLDL